MRIRDIIEENVVLTTVDDWVDFYNHDHFTESGFFRGNDDINRNSRIQPAAFKQDK